ncbi:MAG: DNA repair protein RecO [Brumimicrobium sp.]|nr:DNA repair protein RecO [Brumimicrobium sp.]
MKQVLNGILLKKINYSETSLILHFFTRENGLQSFIFQGGKKKKGNLLHALSMVEIESYHRPESEMGRISAISPNHVLSSIPFDPVKSGIAFFLTEVISFCLKSTESDLLTYEFLTEEILWLDSTEDLANYPVWFLIRFSEMQGFSPQVVQSEAVYFDLQEGELTRSHPSGHAYVKDNSVPELEKLLSKTRTEILADPISKAVRRLLVLHLIEYYKIHISGFKTPKSLEIMQTILHD